MGCLRRLFMMGVAGTAVLVASLTTWWIRTDSLADRFFEDDASVVLPLARSVAQDVTDGITPDRFGTGDPRFDGEWALVTCQMALVGFAQIVAQHPEARFELVHATRLCTTYLVSSEARRFGTAAWGQDGLEALDGNDGHAYLGWLNLALASSLQVDPDPAIRQLHNALSAGLARRMAAPIHRLETYPGESYPPDMVMVAASVALHGGHDAVVRDWRTRFARTAVDPSTGLLHQALSSATGDPRDDPRGSGTALAATFLPIVDAELAQDLAWSIHEQLRTSTLGFGGVREVPVGASPRMDIDSGPVIYGVSMAATGFGIGASRVSGARSQHRSLFRTAQLFGLGWGWSDKRRFVTGGALGNAILLAMLTTPRPI